MLQLGLLGAGCCGVLVAAISARLPIGELELKVGAAVGFGGCCGTACQALLTTQGELELEAGAAACLHAGCCDSLAGCWSLHARCSSLLAANPSVLRERCLYP